MRYGLPYMGSKNSIAEKIIEALPPAEHFYDVFMGGGAITHVALLSGKYKYIHSGDISDIVDLFKNAVKGKYKEEQRWIDRETFKKLKDSDPYIRYVWSFGNRGGSYLYSKEIEPYKKAYHYACFGDFSYFDEFYKLPRLKRKELCSYIRKNQAEIKNNYIEWYKKVYFTKGYPISYFLAQSLQRLEILQSLQRLESLERLQSLESLERLQSLEIRRCGYQDWAFAEDSVIYCDPPYNGTEKYISGDFDHNEFYKWAESKENIFISEYNMPEDRFKCIKEIPKQKLLGSSGSRAGVERLYIPIHNDYKTNLLDFI